MPFVEMKNARFNSELSQQSHTTDAQHFFLHHARLAIAAVEMSCYQAVGFSILRNIRVQQIELYPSDAHTPGAGPDGPAAHRHFDQNRLLLCILDQFKRQFVSIVFPVRFFLPATEIQTLSKVTEAIEQADRHERQIEIARRFQMIAGEHSQSTGIERQRVVHTILGTEISDRILARYSGRKLQLLPGLVVGNVRVKALHKFLDAFRKDWLGGHLSETKVRNPGQQNAWILFALRPKARIYVAKNVRTVGCPAPPIIPG